MSTGDLPQIVGLSGGIASGKSTVSQVFQDLGVVVIDADEIARAVVEPGKPAHQAIREAFGNVFLEDQTLDREAMGKRVFNDPDARKQLNQIVHPEVGLEMMRRAAHAKAEGHAWVIYDAALLVENGLHHMFPALIIVSTSADTQKERLMKRDGFSAEDAQKRIDAQLPLDQKIQVATHIIDNNGSLDATLKQCRAVFDDLVSTYGTP